MDNIIEKLGITKAPWKVIDKNQEYKLVDFESVHHDENFEYPIISAMDDRVCIYEDDLRVLLTAPEMLEALIQITKELDNDGRFNNTVIAIGEVIQKATGKSWEEIKRLLGEIN